MERESCPTVALLINPCQYGAQTSSLKYLNFQKHYFVCCFDVLIINVLQLTGCCRVLDDGRFTRISLASAALTGQDENVWDICVHQVMVTCIKEGRYCPGKLLPHLIVIIFIV